MKIQKNRLTIKFIIKFYFLFVFCTAIFSCADQKMPENAANSTPQKTPTEFERELKSLKTVDFNYIFAFRRKDGEAFNREDKTFLKRKTYQANRHILTKDEKVVFVGTNYKLAKKDFKSLKKRFDVQDFSKSDDQIKKEKTKKESANTDQNNTNPNK